METTITGTVYLHMLQLFLIPRLDEDNQEERIRFQQDGAPPHYSVEVREYLNTPHYLAEVREYLSTRFPGRWIGRASPIAWPPRSPILHPWIFLTGIR
jgi:hypothetical protein